MRAWSLICLSLLGCRVPEGPDAGVDGGEGERCWAPSGIVFASEGPTPLAQAYVRDGGSCFSVSSRYRLGGLADGGFVELATVGGTLQSPTKLAGIFVLETRSGDELWAPLQRLYFARPARGSVIPRTCLRGESIAKSFACNGRLELDDGGSGPTADDWLDGDGIVYGFLDGGIVAGASVETLLPFAAPSSVADVSSWAGDLAGLATMSSSNMLSLFAPDGGRRDIQLQEDAGMGPVFRRAARSYFSRPSRQFGAEICEAETLPDSGCRPGYVNAAAGDNAWGPSAIGGGDWLVLPYAFDGGWIEDSLERSFLAPTRWTPDLTPHRAMQGGVVVRAPNRLRVLVWSGVRDGRDDMVLFELSSPVVAAGVRSSVAWVSWDGGTLVSR